MSIESLPAGHPGHINLGLIANPFDVSHTALDPETDPLGVQLEVHSAALTTLAAIYRAVETGDSKPLWIERDTSVSHYYHISALSEFMETLTGSQLGVLPIHISLNELRMGRIRSALNALAHYVGGQRFGETLGRWMQEAFETPDEEILAEMPSAAQALRDHASELTADPIAAAERLFGEDVFEREGTDVDRYVRESSVRQGLLESDPAEDDSSAETGEGIAFSLLGAGDGELSSGEGGESRWEDDVAEYVVAYARAHLSPVIARAIKAYAAEGNGPATEELKITKAPKKTLKALLRFVRHTLRKVVFIYDQFDLWPMVPGDLRSSILGALSEMRWAVEEDGLIVIVGDPNDAPEVREQFASAKTIPWSMPNVEPAFRMRDGLDTQMVDAWLAAAALSDTAPSAQDAPVARLLDAAQGSLSRFATAMRVAIDDAASRSADSLDDAAAEAAMETL